MKNDRRSEIIQSIEETIALQYGKPSKNDPRKTPAKPGKEKRDLRKILLSQQVNQIKTLNRVSKQQIPCRL